MGVLRTDAEPQTTASPGAATRAAGGTRGSGARRRWTAMACYLGAAAILFTAYLRLSETYQLNSDSANILLMGWDLLHGNLLLHGWYMSDVSFYPTELPQYALLEAIFGLGMQTAHIAAAMTYTLVLLLAVLLARSGSSGRAALIRALAVAGIMLAPEIGYGVFALDLSVGHIGTAAPLLLVWLLLDRAPPRWYVPVLTAVLLAWVLVADPIVYVVGVGPLGCVAALRVIRDFRAGTGRWRGRLAGLRYDLSLGVAAVAATALAWIANNVISALGGYTVNRLPFYFTSWGNLHNDLPALWKVLQVFGADPIKLSGIWLALAFLHFASVLMVGWALARVARRFYAARLADQVLAVAIFLNVLLYLLTNASAEASHEVAIIVPFGAALAARMLIAPKLQATRAWPERASRPARVAHRLASRFAVLRTAGAGRARARGGAAGLSRSPRVRVAAGAAGIAVLAGYTAGFGYELTQPSQPPANVSLATWLVDHHLTYGLSGYWSSSSTTVASGQRVRIAPLAQYTLQQDLWMSKTGWYNGGWHYANFVVLDSQPGNFSFWEPTQLVRKYFGTPTRTYHTGPYTIMVYPKNLLADVNLHPILPVAPGQFSPALSP